jgi:3-isopropylmalate/(R)-2-methylmalate dehydratase large subunit
VKIPTKKELIELQKKYRTDKKIGEIFGVPGRLVAYWRSKKKIGTYNLPKYSREKITELWERYGSDKLAGTELGVSGPGFRQWRLKYGLKNKPIRLKYEQLELSLPDNLRKAKNSRHETFVQKILAKKAGLKSVEIGQIVETEPDISIVGIEAGLVLNHFKEIGALKVWDKSKIAIIFDRPNLAQTEQSSLSSKTVREFIKKQGIERFYDIGWGASHQVMIEEGLIFPNQLGLVMDDHALVYGGMGAFSTYVTATDMAAIWALGRTWLKTPPSIKIILKGSLTRGVYARDIVLKLFHDFGAGGANYRALEFYGEAISNMSMSQRFIMAGFSREFNVKSVFIPFDDLTYKYFRKITRQKINPVLADINACYENELEIDVSYLTPQIAHINHLSNVKPIEEYAGKRLDLIMMSGCVNGNLNDLELAASILKGRRVHRDTRVFVVPGSRKVYLEALEKGIIRSFVESGCVVASPGLDIQQCSGADSEKSLVTCNCAQMRCGEVYMGSLATAAASALEGAITDPRKYLL